ncbi:MAG: DNA polymerase III subunit gamma/tau [Desulfotignum balticum]|uniref:DNA polymerase III subunit gamma/tau n=1 Tax=Desulfotignum balticum TaxID=115781 RepID=A0A931CQ20_9BACT|nr:DNA polymerase III subunit gamma/tau [Desulfotignum balticum]
MSYQVLALKYRPQTFDDVVGQSHVTTTLVNAILQDRVAHAMLFTGPRGTGKTTIARILAKAMNCTTGPTPTPCNQCKSCTEIIAGHCADVFEIDGASNNSVDQIRDLRENVTYLPAAAAYKIYIIDEVHMLSTAAFNALLKTLEEPPGHVLFIFATTEVHKIPATILSRCQRHDLGRIALEAICELLKKICRKEGFGVQDQGLELIALEADGSVRDALSLLDRILSATPEKTISYEMVVNHLGVLDRRIMHELSDALFEKNVSGLIALVDRVNDAGLDLKKFYGDLIAHFRNLSIIKQCGPDHPAVNLTAGEKKQIHTRVAQMPEAYLGHLLQVLLTDEDMVKRTSHTRIAIETVLFKLRQVRAGASIDRIIAQLDLLAQQMKSGEKMPDTPSDIRPSPPDGDQQMPSGPIQESPPAYTAPAALSPGPDQIRETADEPSPEPPRTWDGFLTRIEPLMPFMHVLLTRGQIASETQDTLEVHLSDCTQFDRKRLKDKQGELEKQCRKFLGKTLKIHVASRAQPLALAQEKAKDAKALQAAASHPLVQTAKEIFNGEIINM